MTVNRPTTKAARGKGRISYSRGFPYGAPLCMIRGGATKREEVLYFLKENGWEYEDAPIFAWKHYMNRREFGIVLKILRDVYGCEVVPKADLDQNYKIDLDDPDFSSTRFLTAEKED